MPSESLLEYRVWCDTEAAWVTTDYMLESQGPPTTCPHDTAHTIDPSRTVIISTVPPDGTYDSDGNLLTVPEPRSGNEVYFYVPNLCDACAWYQRATQVIEQALINSGDDQTYTSGQPSWIDLYHGRVFREDQIPNRNDYKVVVEVDTGGGFAIVAENSWGATDNDYTVDYPTGVVRFNAPLAPTDQVRASYYYGADSTFTIEPEAGKRLKVLYVEVQLTQDVEMTADIVFDILAFNPADPPGPKLLVKSERYKRIIDFFQESTGPYPVIPAFGGSGDRALPSGVVTLPFQYLAYRDLKSSQGVEMQCRVEGDAEFPGHFANATFYCLSELE